MGAEEEESKIYYVIDRNPFGTLTETTTPVWRHPCGVHPEQFHYGLKIHHDNYLRCFYYDKEKNSMFYETYDSDWESRIHNQFFFDKYPIRVNNVPKIDSIYLKLEFREILRSMIRFLVYLHKSRYSLMRFAEENIVFKDNKLKFAAVRFRVSSEQTRREDFDCIYQIVTRMFEGKKISMELDRWIHLIMFLDFKRDDCGSILLYHLAVIPPTESVNFFVYCSERLRRVQNKHFTQFMNAICAMPLLNDWDRSFTPDTVSHSCFDLTRDSYKVTTDYNPVRGRSFKANDVKMSLLRCCRNLVVHLQEHSTSRNLSEVHIERKIMDLFGGYLITLQEKLHENNCLLPFVV